MDSPVNRFSGEQMILASAASADLRHVLRGVIEATAAGGRPRYPPATGHALARAILTRNYAHAFPRRPPRFHDHRARLQGRRPLARAGR